ncbi:MAG: hypothetical protein ACFFCZ_01085 [Promethearchaeota archaeon]
MFKRQMKDFLANIGFKEEISDELLDELIKQLMRILEMGMPNAITIKTGCVLWQLMLANQEEFTEELSERIRTGTVQFTFPPMKIVRKSLCLHLDEQGNCSIVKVPCEYRGNKIVQCEVVQSSIDAGLEEYK